MGEREMFLFPLPCPPRGGEGDFTYSLKKGFFMFKNDDLPDFFKTLSPLEMTLLYHDWRVMGRRAQNPEAMDWFLWIILAGRGWGKTRTGAQWVKRIAWKNKRARNALVAHTAADGRGVRVRGRARRPDFG